MALCFLSGLFAAFWFNSNSELQYLEFEDKSFIEMTLVKFGSWALLFTSFLLFKQSL